MKCKFAFIIDDGVPCISSALIPYYNVEVLRKEINHAALSFITPVDSHYGTVTHFIISID